MKRVKKDIERKREKEQTFPVFEKKEKNSDFNLVLALRNHHMLSLFPHSPRPPFFISPIAPPPFFISPLAPPYPQSQKEDQFLSILVNSWLERQLKFSLNHRVTHGSFLYRALNAAYSHNSHTPKKPKSPASKENSVL